MVSSHQKHSKQKKLNTTLVVLVLLANALIVVLVEQYNESQRIVSREEHERMLSEINSATIAIKDEIVALEGVSSWEETFYASTTKGE